MALSSIQFLFIVLTFTGCMTCVVTTPPFHQLEERQTPAACRTPEFLKCLNGTNSTQFMVNTPEGFRDYRKALLTLFCQESCFQVGVKYFVCLGNTEEESKEIGERGCTKNNGEFCEINFYNGQISGNIPKTIASFCNTSQQCTSNCSATLMSIEKNWGCCTATYVNTTLFPVKKETFTRCAVAVGEPCPKNVLVSGSAYMITPMVFSFIIVLLFTLIV